MRRLLLAGAALAVLAGLAGCQPDDSAQDKAKRDCLAKGGVYQPTNDGKHSGVCLPPKDGWQ